MTKTLMTKEKSLKILNFKFKTKTKKEIFNILIEFV